MRYKLNVDRDVDVNEDDTLVLNLPRGFKFSHDVLEVCHTCGYDTMRDLRQDIKSWVVPCDCKDCI